MNLNEESLCYECGIFSDITNEDILVLDGKAKHWDEYHEEKYDMRPTYQVLEKENNKNKEIVQMVKERLKFVKTRADHHDPNCTDWCMEETRLEGFLGEKN